jgi:hypothetical protein
MKNIFIILVAIFIFSGCTTKNVSNEQPGNTSQKTVNKQTESNKSKLNILDGEVFYDTCKQSGMDTNTIVEINGGYLKDKNNVYWNHRIGCDLLRLENVDVSSFEALNEFFGKDKNNVYAGNKKVQGADPATFEITKIPGIPDWACAKDKNRIYKHPYLTEDNNGNPIDAQCNVIK